MGVTEKLQTLAPQSEVTWKRGGDLAHQLGTGELVGLAPHCRHREGQLGGFVHDGSSTDLPP